MPVREEPDDDERVAALQRVLRSNGVGGPSPYTIEGEIAQMGNIGRAGVRGRGWRRWAARGVVFVTLAPFLIVLLLDVGYLLRHGIG